MNIQTHHIRNHFTSDERYNGSAAISLPAIPGITITNDRSETTPRQQPIRHNVPRKTAVGAAAKQKALARVEMFRAALVEVREEQE